MFPYLFSTGWNNPLLAHAAPWWQWRWKQQQQNTHNYMHICSGWTLSAISLSLIADGHNMNLKILTVIG